MEHLANLLKLVLERGSWIAAVALAGLALAVGRQYGYLLDMDKTLVHGMYLAAGICGFVLLTGTVTSSYKNQSQKLSKLRTRAAVQKKALENLPTLPHEYKHALVWMYVFNKRRISEQGNTSTLDTLYEQGYVDKDFPDAYHVVKTYTVTDEVWSALQKIDKSKLRERLDENTPPWRDSWRI